jgi:hypothetical protein
MYTDDLMLITICHEYSFLRPIRVQIAWSKTGPTRILRVYLYRYDREMTRRSVSESSVVTSADDN